MIDGDNHDSSSDGHDHVDINSQNKTLHITRNNEFFLNDLNFMPVYEIKSLKAPKNGQFDIFVDDEVADSEDEKSNAWDTSLSLDYNKL